MNAIYPDGYLQHLPDDLHDANGKMLEKLMPYVHSGLGSVAEQKEFMRAFGIYQAWREYRGLPVNGVAVSGNFGATLAEIRNTIIHYDALFRSEENQRSATTSIESGKEWFAMQSGGLFFYEFTEDEVNEIQRRINELRELVSATSDLEEPHKARLLRRLEQLQMELNKRMSDLDRFWGLVGDAGVAIRKFGKDTKRVAGMLAAIKAITWIIWKAQLQAHQLPPDTHHPLLLPPHEQKSDTATPRLEV